MNTQLSSPIKLIFALIVLFFSGNVKAQQELSLHFMKNLIQNNETNPASISNDKFTFSLPSFYANYYNSAFSINDFGQIENGVLTLAPEQALNKLKGENNLIQGNINLSIASISFRIKQLQFRLFHNSNFDLYSFYPKEMMELLWYGNGESIGEQLEVAPKIDLFTYHEYGMGFAIQTNDKISIGTNIKYLAGLLNINSKKTQANLFTSEDHYQLSAQTDLMIYSSGLSAFLEESSDDLIIYDDDNNWFLNQNSGLALDFGVNYQVSNKLSLGLSVLDLGFINWRENAILQSSSGEFDFDGITVKPFDNNNDYDFQTVLDSVGNLVEFESQIMKDGYKTQLPMRYYLSGTYKIDSTLSLGALSYGEYYRGNFSPAFAINVQKRIRNFFEFGSTIALHKNLSPNLGLNLSLRLAGIQIYGITDNIFPILNLTNGRNFNVRLGINVAIKGKSDLVNDLDEKLIAEETDGSLKTKENQMNAKKIKSKKSLVAVSKKKEYYRRTDKY